MSVGYAYATLYPRHVKRLVLVEAPIPGTEAETLIASSEFPIPTQR